MAKPLKNPPPAVEVLINGRFLGQRVTGIQRYGRETLLNLDELLAGKREGETDWTLLVPRGTQTPAFKRIRVEALGRFGGHFWEQFELPWRARNGLLFSFGFTGPLLLRRQIVTVHDAAVFRMPHAFRWQFRLWYRWLVRHLVKRSPCTVAVSRFSAGETTECFGAEPARIRIATEGWQHLQRIEAATAILDRHNLRGRPFALAVSSPTPSKNFALILAALRQLGDNAPLCVVAGAADPAIFKDAGLATDGILHLGYVSDAELKALYEAATCFVFPSRYEGFGIPPLEAMASGCPVLASTAPAVAEVCGDAARYFDPDQPEALAKLMLEVFTDTRLRQDMQTAGRARAEHYSWTKNARLNLEFIEEVLCTT